MRKLLPIVVAASVILVGATVLWLLDRALVARALSDERTLVSAHAATIRSELESELNARLFLAQGLSALVLQNPDITPEEFRTVGAELFHTVPDVRSIQLARDSVVSHVYPLDHGTRALGSRLPDSTEQHEAIRRAIESGSMVVAGPIDLGQDGSALVARRPIFLPPGPGVGEPRYWGLATVVIDTASLWRNAGISVDGAASPDHLPLWVALRGRDGKGSSGAPFWGPRDVFHDDPVTFDIQLPGGSWQLAAIPQAGWGHGLGWTTPFRVLVALALLGVSVLSFVSTRNVERLRQEHEKRVQANIELQQRASDLERALEQVKTLKGLLPICSSCKKIRDDQGLWNRIERYIEDHSDAQFTHGMCPTCAREFYGAEITDAVLARIEQNRTEEPPRG